MMHALTSSCYLVGNKLLLQVDHLSLLVALNFRVLCARELCVCDNSRSCQAIDGLQCNIQEAGVHLLQHDAAESACCKQLVCDCSLVSCLPMWAKVLSFALMIDLACMV